jgi:hypothetical protein
MLVDSNKLRLESKQRGSTYIASSKFFSAMALLPSALSASAIASCSIREILGVVYLFCDLESTNVEKVTLEIRQPFSTIDF